MTLFIQSLSGLVLIWYTKRDFSKCHTWEDMAQDIVKQYELNIEGNPCTNDLLRVHEFFLSIFHTMEVGSFKDTSSTSRRGIDFILNLNTRRPIF